MSIRADIVNYFSLFKCRLKTTSSPASSVAFLLLSLGSGSIYGFLFLFSYLIEPSLIGFKGCFFAVDNSSFFTKLCSLHFHFSESHVKSRLIIMSVVDCGFSLSDVYGHEVVLLLHVSVKLVFAFENFFVKPSLLIASIQLIHCIVMVILSFHFKVIDFLDYVSDLIVLLDDHFAKDANVFPLVFVTSSVLLAHGAKVIYLIVT